MDNGRVFNSYKGLQKPLVFKMFKGRYIYIALGTLVGAFLIGILMGIIISMSVGVVVLLVLGLGGLFAVLMSQRSNGLHQKDKRQGVFIVTHRKLSKFER